MTYENAENDKRKNCQNENAALLKNAEIRNPVLVKINENVVF
jgi:hypothetical protein